MKSIKVSDLHRVILTLLKDGEERTTQWLYETICREGWKVNYQRVWQRMVRLQGEGYVTRLGCTPARWTITPRAVSVFGLLAQAAPLEETSHGG